MSQDALRPRFLRRMKEDVETLPEKEEVVVWVELTAQQRLFYKSIYEKKVCFESIARPCGSCSQWGGCVPSFL